MRIIGIDPGTAITGFGVIDPAGPSMIAGGVIRTPAKQALELRVKTLFEELTELVKHYNPEIMAIEQLFFSKNVTTAMSVAQARGIALLVAAQFNLDVVEYTPNQVKQAITGYGNADKKQMQEMVKLLLKLDTIPKPDDAADALAIAICHSHVMSA